MAHGSPRERHHTCPFTEAFRRFTPTPALAGLAAAATSGSPRDCAPGHRCKLGLVARNVRASRPSLARRSCAACRSRSTRSTPRAACSAEKVELVVRDDESNPAKGVVAARELVQREKVARAVRRPRHAGVDRHRAVRQPEQGAVHGRLGGRHADHPQRRGGKLRVPRLRGGRTRRQGAGRLRDQEIFREEARDDPDQQSLGRVERDGSEEPRWRQRTCAYAGIEKFQDADVDVVPQLTRLKEAGADVLFMVANVAPSSQVVKSLDRMGWNVPIVSHWGPAGGRFSELAGPERPARPLHPDLQLLRQAVAEGRDGARGAEEEISRNQDAGGRDARRSASPTPMTRCI